MNKKFHMTPAKLTAALFAVILLTVPIVTIALPKQERSENENRWRSSRISLTTQKWTRRRTWAMCSALSAGTTSPPATKTAGWINSRPTFQTTW